MTRYIEKEKEGKKKKNIILPSSTVLYIIITLIIVKCLKIPAHSLIKGPI
jgi:hypothetical protein